MASRFRELQQILTNSDNKIDTSTSEDGAACSAAPMPPVINIDIETSDGLVIKCPYIDFLEISFEEEIGCGTFGVVFKAFWRDRYVAVKEFDDNSKRNAFETQIKHLSRVNHANIIAFYGISTNRMPKYLIMEYADGGSLHQYLHGREKPPYSMAHAMSWVRQCAEAIAYMHAMKPKPLVHRDLRPHNLLLTDKARYLKICGFGTANDIATILTNNKRSAAWMAPEIFESSKYTRKCDVYSWGIILWEVLSREIFFKDYDNNYAIMWKVYKGERPLPITDLPENIEKLMTSCWAKEPELRPSMEYVLEKMNILMQEYPGSDEPLNYDFFYEQNISDNESTGNGYKSDSSYCSLK